MQLSRGELHGREARQGPLAAALSLPLPPAASPALAPPSQPPPQQQQQLLLEAMPADPADKPGEGSSATAAALAPLRQPARGFSLLSEDKLPGTCAVCIPGSSAAAGPPSFLEVSFDSLLGAAKDKVGSRVLQYRAT